MRIKLLILTFLYLFFGAGLASAISPPVQTSPIDNSQVSSSKLTWETPSYPLYSNNPYRIQVDDNSDFASVYRDYKTKNTYYTPVLTEGTWYWRIKVKDSSDTWSDWSDSWSFILTTSTPSPTPTATPSSTLSPSPTSTPNNLSTPKPKTTSTTSKTPTPTANPTASPPTQDTTATPIPSKSKPKVNYQIASVAATAVSATPSAKVEIKSQKQSSFLVWAGIILVFAGILSIGYIYLKRNGTIFNSFRRGN